MITKKELDYVNVWASKVPFPGEEYCHEAAEKLKQSFNLYNSRHSNKRYNISFSNNEEIELQIFPHNLCHLLGIEYKNLSNDYFMKIREEILKISPNQKFNSYDLLSSIIDHIDDVILFDERESRKLSKTRLLNYYKIFIKCDIFTKLADLSKFNYGCINFTKDKLLRNNPDMKFCSNSTKYLFTPSDEIVSSYFMMGIKEDENHRQDDENLEDVDNEETRIYIPETLFAPIEERIPSYFEDQEIIIPTQILLDDNGTLIKNVASSSEKLSLLREYQNMINKYRVSCNVNIYNDYLSLLMSDEREKVKSLQM